MEALDNRCPSCGAKITFNPEIQKWDCEYCGSQFSLEEMQKYRNASSEEVNQGSKREDSSNTKLKDLDVYHCKNCGAEIMADATIAATFCVYCGSTAILKERIEAGRAPDLIILFKNVKEDAVRAFRQVVKHKPLTPKCFKNEKNIQKITGVYIPFWAYDFKADGEMEFLARDIRTWSDYHYQYTETRKYEVRNRGHFDYSKVLADASTRFADDLMDSLEPFEYDQLEKYNHAYLSGFLAEKYDVEEDKALERAEKRTMNTCVQLLSDSILHQSKTLRDNQMKLEKVASYYIMLPVWMVNIQYNNKYYLFAMNGQTGKIVGNLPIGVKEVILWSVFLFLIFFLLGWGVMYLV